MCEFGTIFNCLAFNYELRVFLIPEITMDRLQMGRAGRGGDQSVCVLIRRKGERTPPEMRKYLKPESNVCLKKGIEQIFTLSDPDGGFSSTELQTLQC